jgi:hypothetical protein
VLKLLFTNTLRRSYGEMLEEAMENLQSKTDITNFHPGSIARSLLEVYYDDLDKENEMLELAAAVGFLTSDECKNEYVDEIAKLFDMERYPNEADENFKFRIQKHTQSKAMANKMAVRLACLSVDGVRDVTMKPYTRGTGSFGVYVISEEPETPASIIEQVQREIDETKAYGIRAEAIEPKNVYLDLDIMYVFYENTDPSIKESIIYEAENQLREFFINKDLGSELILNQIIDLLMDIDQESIKNLFIRDMRLDDVQVIINDKSFYWDERIVPKNISIK